MVKNFEELWPLPIPEIVVVTGKFGCGKSTFAQGTGARPERTVTIDFEKSQKTDAEQLPINYLDVQAEMSKKFPNGYKAIDLYNWVVAELDKLETGKFDVIILDNASPLEEAILAYVEKNAQEFGHTPGQYSSMSGMKWGDVKTKYAQLLTRWVSKAKMIFIIVHLRDKWVGNSVLKDATGHPVQEPKGKETLEMLSSLFVWLETGPGGIPAARVLKSRIAKKVFVDDPENPPTGIPQAYIDALMGEPGMVTVPVLPLRIPQCTWPQIRNYMRHPADLQNPKPGEKLSDKEMTEDERLRVRSIIAQSEAVVAEAEKLKIESGMDKTKENLVAFARILGLDASTVGLVLSKNGMAFDPDHWEKMKQALRDYKANLPLPTAAD